MEKAKKVYECIALRNWKASIAGREYIFKEGKTYRLTVKEDVDTLTHSYIKVLKVVK